ncbi:hypothetical protein FF38_03553, partial [Lucilia cuprina]
MTLVAALLLAGCTSSDSLAQQYRDGNQKGYIAGDFQIVEIPDPDRGEPVAFEGVTETGETLAGVADGQLPARLRRPRRGHRPGGGELRVRPVLGVHVPAAHPDNGDPAAAGPRLSRHPAAARHPAPRPRSPGAPRRALRATQSHRTVAAQPVAGGAAIPGRVLRSVPGELRRSDPVHRHRPYPPRGRVPGRRDAVHHPDPVVGPAAGADEPRRPRPGRVRRGRPARLLRRLPDDGHHHPHRRVRRPDERAGHRPDRRPAPRRRAGLVLRRGPHLADAHLRHAPLVPRRHRPSERHLTDAHAFADTRPGRRAGAGDAAPHRGGVVVAGVGGGAGIRGRRPAAGSRLRTGGVVAVDVRECHGRLGGPDRPQHRRGVAGRHCVRRRVLHDPSGVGGGVPRPGAVACPRRAGSGPVWRGSGADRACLPVDRPLSGPRPRAAARGTSADRGSVDGPGRPCHDRNRRALPRRHLTAAGVDGDRHLPARVHRVHHRPGRALRPRQRPAAGAGPGRRYRTGGPADGQRPEWVGGQCSHAARAASTAAVGADRDVADGPRVPVPPGRHHPARHRRGAGAVGEHVRVRADRHGLDRGRLPAGAAPLRPPLPRCVPDRHGGAAAGWRDGLVLRRGRSADGSAQERVAGHPRLRRVPGHRP